MKKLLIMIVPLIALFPVGCRVPVGEDNPSTETTGGQIEEVSDLFVQQADGGYLFTTNDPAYWGPYGYTLWAMPCPTQATFTRRDVTLIKTSGNANAGYGIVFCQYDTGNASHDETMLVVMINKSGQYSVGEATSSVYSAYTSSLWIQDAHLAQGDGMPNEVEVARDASGLFTLSLNKTPVMTFHDGRTPLHTGGGQGYIAVISPQDSCPSIPVSVTYKE